MIMTFTMMGTTENLIPLLGGVSRTAWPNAVRTDCSARPIRNLPPRDLQIEKKEFVKGVIISSGQQSIGITAVRFFCFILPNNQVQRNQYR